MTLDQLTTFLAWSSVVHIAFLLFATFMLFALRDWAMGIHSAMLGVDRVDLPRLYFQYLAGYKLLILVFFIVPYLVLRLLM